MPIKVNKGKICCGGRVVKRTKQILGILMIILAVGAVVYWETDGRERIVTKKVLVAVEEIAEGEVITRRMLSVVNAMPETVVAGAFSPGELSKAEGKVAQQTIQKNQQISEILLREPYALKQDKRSPFVIKSDWIDSRSSSLRRGDIVAIYGRDTGRYLGDFEVVYVKDIADREITDAQPYDIRDRENGSGIIDHLEILTDIDGYLRLLRFIDETQEKLIIVQTGG